MSMRGLMQIVEGRSRVFYHGAMTFLPIGTVLDPSLKRDTLRYTQADERCLEYYRPAGMIPRCEAVFLASSHRELSVAGGINYRFAYEVEPIGVVERSNQYWHQLLYSLDGDHRTGKLTEFSEETLDEEGLNSEFIVEAARNYWAGVKAGPRVSFDSEWGTRFSKSIWEYRCRHARIVGWA